MTQSQIDIEIVTGWRDAALAARENTMVPFYERIIAALKAQMAVRGGIYDGGNQ